MKFRLPHRSSFHTKHIIQYWKRAAYRQTSNALWYQRIASERSVCPMHCLLNYDSRLTTYLSPDRRGWETNAINKRKRRPRDTLPFGDKWLEPRLEAVIGKRETYVCILFSISDFCISSNITGGWPSASSRHDQTPQAIASTKGRKRAQTGFSPSLTREHWCGLLATISMQCDAEVALCCRMQCL